MCVALQELRGALADAEAKKAAAGGAVEADEEVAQLRAEAEEKEAEFGDLLSCLGQESAKVAALQGLLSQHGVDASALLAQVRSPLLSFLLLGQCIKIPREITHVECLLLVKSP